LEQLVKGISACVTTLGLGNNWFAMHALAELIPHIPSNIKTLYLNANNFGLIKKNGEAARRLLTSIAVIPQSVTSLFLGKNNLSALSGALLGDIFANVPAGITLLSLDDNVFGSSDDERISISELAQAMSKLPETVMSLNLAGNAFFYLTGDQLATLFLQVLKHLI
jgi:hypothetical protein